jgi:DNA-directed RNA polymerase specialized sigma subunit
MALWAVREYRGMPDYDDVLQEARIGYWQAEQTWKPEKGKLSTHAKHRMWSRVKHYLRDYLSLIKIPAYQQERGTDYPSVMLLSDVEDVWL